MIDDLPVVSPPFDDVGRDDPPRVAAVLLAAGTSDRFGTGNKLLAAYEGDPLVRHAARTLVEADVDPVIVVVGYDADRVRGALDGLPVDTVSNEAFESGQAASVRTGVREVRSRAESADAVLVALGDMPDVEPETIDTLVAAYDATVGTALAAAYDGDRGNPVLFDRQYFDALAAVSGDTGGRRVLLDTDDSVLVDVDDRGVRLDVDVPSDL